MWERNQLQGFIDALVELVENNHERPVSENTWQQILGLDALIGHKCLELGISIPSLGDDTAPEIQRLGFTKVLYRKLHSGRRGVFTSDNWQQAMSALRIAAIADGESAIPAAKKPKEVCSAEEALEIAKFCKDEADALRELFRHTGSPEPSLMVIRRLDERLRRAGQFDLAAKIDLKDPNPEKDSVLFLLSGIQQSLQEFAQQPSKPIDAPVTPQTSANQTGDENNKKLFPLRLPTNPDIVDLAVLLNTGRDSGKSKNEIAREFTGESPEQDRRAQSLLSQIRRLVREGKVKI